MAVGSLSVGPSPQHSNGRIVAPSGLASHPILSQIMTSAALSIGTISEMHL